jgi:hypothetical protein
MPPGLPLSRWTLSMAQADLAARNLEAGERKLLLAFFQVHKKGGGVFTSEVLALPLRDS